ncbi:MAG TPA: O-antigen ligase family protein [Candidatus Omnitrophota bacterium]|nr:O-antigen ligase family protein [Candidatus Omnitrophota bacterium]
MKEKFIRYLDFVIYWSIILMPFSVACGPAPANVFIGLMSSHFIIKKIVQRQGLRRSNALVLPILGLIAVGFISFINSINLHSSVQGIVKLVKAGLIVVVCVEEIKDRRHALRICLSIFAGATLASFDAFWQMTFGRDFLRGNEPMIYIGSIKRATAAFSHTNILGVYLSACIPLCLALSLYYWSRFKKGIALVLSALCIYGVYVTFSRGAVLAVLTGIIILAIARRDKLILGGLVLILLVTPFIMPKRAVEFMKSVNYNPAVVLFNQDRMSAWRNAANMVKHHPVIGVGVNTFSINYGKYKLAEHGDQITGSSFYAHNIYLQMAGETGLLGLSCFIWFLAVFFFLTAAAYTKTSEPLQRAILLGLMASVAAFLINGISETSLYYARVSMIFWFLIGFAVAMANFNKEQKNAACP